MNGDYGIEAELSKYFSVSDTFNYWDVRIPGHSLLVSNIWDDTPWYRADRLLFLLRV